MRLRCYGEGMRTGIPLFLFLAGRLSAQQFAVRSTDGSWYLGNSINATIEKRSADLSTQFWKVDGDAGATRGLRATPDGGVARLTTANSRFTKLAAWDAGGAVSFVKDFLMSEPRMAVDSSGDFLIAGDSLRILRLNRRGEPMAEKSVPVNQVTSLAGIELSADGHLFAAGVAGPAALNVTPDAAQKERRSGLCIAGFRVPYAYPCFSGWVGRFNAVTFALEALTYLGGVDENFLNALALDPEGQPVVAGVAKQRLADEEPYPRTSGAAAPSPRERTGQVMTLSRLSADLSQVLHSTWLAGSDEASAVALAVDPSGRLLISGTTTSPNFPATVDWTRVCGPRRGANAISWNFGLRLSASFDRIEGTTQFGEAVAPELIDFDTRANCIFNGGSYDFSRQVATGQIVAMIGGPFRDDDRLTLNGLSAPILYRSEAQINFVIPREAGTGTGFVLELSGQMARRLDVREARPAWIWNISDDGTLSNRGNFQINARRANGSLNSDRNGILPGEEVLAYATGIDLAKPLQLFQNFYDKPLANFQAEYVPGTFESVVQFRFRTAEFNGGVNVMGIVNAGSYSGSNPGFIWLGPPVAIPGGAGN